MNRNNLLKHINGAYAPKIGILFRKDFTQLQFAICHLRISRMIFFSHNHTYFIFIQVDIDQNFKSFSYEIPLVKMF